MPGKGGKRGSSSRGRKPISNIEEATDSLTVEVDALLTRMGGLSSAGIVQALASMNKDSAWFAGEMVRMYEGTDESYYKEKMLKMMTEFIKQHEGQKITIDPLASATNDELKQLEAKALASVEALIGDGNGAQKTITVNSNTKSLPAPKRGRVAQSKGGKSKARRRDAEPVRAAAKAKGVSQKQSRRKSVPGR